MVRGRFAEDRYAQKTLKAAQRAAHVPQKAGKLSDVAVTSIPYIPVSVKRKNARRYRFA
jgi:hypothetical protein